MTKPDWVKPSQARSGSHPACDTGVILKCSYCKGLKLGWRLLQGISALALPRWIASAATAPTREPPHILR